MKIIEISSSKRGLIKASISPKDIEIYSIEQFNPGFKTVKLTIDKESALKLAQVINDNFK